MKALTIYTTGVLCVLLAGCAGSKTGKQSPAAFSDYDAMQNSQNAGAPSKTAPTASGKGDAKAGTVQTTNSVGVTLKSELTPDLLQPSKTLFTLGPGDAIEIEIIGNATSRTLTQVGLDGKIYYSLLPGLDVWGMTLDQAREALEKNLAKYIGQPQVGLNLRVVASKHVWVLGRMNKPGIFPLTGSMTLLEALAMAGGAARSASETSSQELADLRHSFVVRGGQFLPVDFYRLLHSGDMTQNIYLQPDDFVYVPSALANEIYVLGAVKVPRALAYVEPMSLISALAGADGPERLDILSHSDSGPFMKNAYLSHVAVVRGSLAEPQVIVVDAEAVFKGRASDVRLQPGDIVYVPNSPYTTLKRYFNMIVNSFVTTIAANEGIRAGGNTTPVSVTVPVSVPAPVNVPVGR